MLSETPDSVNLTIAAHDDFLLNYYMFKIIKLPQSLVKFLRIVYKGYIKKL